MAQRSPYFVPPPPPPPPPPPGGKSGGGAPEGPKPSAAAGVRTLAIVLGTLVAVSLVALIALPSLLDRKAHDEPEQNDAIKKFKTAPKKHKLEKEPPVLQILATDPTRGGRRPRVTIVEFGDYQDPFTARLETTLKDLLDKYGKDLRIVWKDQPLSYHKEARRAARLARVVFFEKSPERYWDFHDKMLREQPKLVAELDVWADSFGADKAAIGMYGENADKLIDASIKLAGEVRAAGSPVCFIDGEKLAGAKSQADFEKIIDAHLTEAAELVAKGVDDEDLYAELVTRHYDDDEPSPGVVYQVDASSGPTWGAADALVTIVLFADFERPPAKPDGLFLGDLLALPDTRLILRDVPGSPASRVAAKLVRAVGDKGGNVERANAIDDLFTYGLPADWTKWGARFGLSATEVSAAIAAAPTDKGIDDDADRAFEVDATSTAVYVNGRRQYSLKKSDVITAHAREKKHAERLIARGVAKSDVYAELTKKGLKKTPKHVTLTVPTWSPVRGPASAKVTIHVFSDFQCPFCRRTATPGKGGFADAVAAHPDVRIVFRHNPLVFHKLAEPAAQMTMEAKAQKGNAGFWAAHDALWAGSAPLDMARIESIAVAQGLDLTKVRAAIAGHLHKKELDDDVAEAKRIGATGTPTFVVGDELVTGAQPLAVFDAAIRRARAKAGP